MASTSCRHADVREFDGLRSCLACGETSFRGDESEVLDVASAQEQEYMYSDLRCLERGHMIRLVLLSPGQPEDPIQCTINLSGLHSEYDAVSYTWATEEGDASKSEPIYIDQSLFKVTKNCAAALRCLRNVVSTRRLWIDAICINQANVRERNHQVGLMDKIYRNASTVHVCIFDPDEDYSTCMQAIIADDYEIFNQWKWRRLFNTRYFRRVWILQEVALARAISLHVNGDHAVSTRNLTSILKAKCLKDDLHLSDHPEALEGSNSYDIRDIRVQLRVSAASSCSDPRDKVYGILSLLEPHIRMLIPVDYSEPSEYAFANAVVACICTSKTLDVLQYAQLPDSFEDLSNAPGFTIEKFNDYLCDSKISHLANKGLQGKNLSVSKLGPQWRPTVSFSASSGDSLIERLPMPLPKSHILPRLTLRAQRMDISRGPSELKVQTFFDIYSVANFEGYPLLPPTAPDLTSLRYDFLPLTRLDSEKNLFARIWETGARKGWVFGTESGLGVSLMKSLPGDEIFSLDGVKQFFLLRPLKDSGYRIVSACSWYGIENCPPPGLPERIELY